MKSSLAGLAAGPSQLLKVLQEQLKESVLRMLECSSEQKWFAKSAVAGFFFDGMYSAFFICRQSRA